MRSILQRTDCAQRGLFPVEKAVLVYVALTLIMMLFLRERLYNAPQMLLLRAEVLLTMAVLYVVYRLYPCALTVFLRIGAQLTFLVAWYPDTYEFNRCLPNLDHLFCAAEQSLFGCQPSLVLSRVLPSPVVSELLDMSYASFYPIIAVTVLFYFFCRRVAFQHATYIITATFLLYFLVFDLLPVVGPTFYFRAVGVDVVEQGIFPSIGHYFGTHCDLAADSLPSPGWHKGVMWQLVEMAKHSAERPTAAFPSSHIGMATVCLILLWRTGSKRVFWYVFPFAFLMLFATIYIQAHYAIDVVAGLLSGLLFYCLAACTYTPLAGKRRE